MSRSREPDDGGWDKGWDGGWLRRSSRQIFASAWFRLRQDEITLPGGDDITYTVIEHDGWAMTVPVLADGPSVLGILLAADHLGIG
jgi:hypothetical protein